MQAVIAERSDKGVAIGPLSGKKSWLPLTTGVLRQQPGPPANIGLQFRLLTTVQLSKGLSILEGFLLYPHSPAKSSIVFVSRYNVYAT